jgi:hypothetical protein
MNEKMNKLVEVNIFRKITDHLKRIYRIYLELTKSSRIGISQHVTGWNWNY